MSTNNHHHTEPTNPPPTMKAILITRPGPPSTLQIHTTIPLPQPTPGTVRIRIRAFGVNHAEMHMRRGEWAESVPISGIECVGTVDACPGGEFVVGEPVAAVMGGMGRTVPGSYAQYTVRLLIRGATSAFGRAAVNLAVEAGAVVTGTTRSEAKFAELRALGVADVLLEGPGLPERVKEKFDRVLELVGNSTVVESLTLVKRDGRVCLAGWLGGLDPIKDFNPLLQMVSGVHLNFFGSFVFGNPEFPLSDVPLNSIVRAVADGKFDAKPFKVFRFDEIQEAHQYMEDGRAAGKMVVVVD
ncbi:chaperonin 10-like protein [Chaetomium tenue]|uniref:Chaperonin 10-like protein n=1 Tax=Chaetomium tenue TaxID=1854479 RepID=A0ACB7PS80_9PEZI|nr:chaperonin 10-like protein [Chaetomium globosum]